MADAYLAISEIAQSPSMNDRMRAAATQQSHLGNTPDIDPNDPLTWVSAHAYLWASSPGWGEAWDYAKATHPPAEDEPAYDPGKDPGVITDSMILATVQALGAVQE